MRRKIIEQQRQLEANDLNLDLENNKSSAMYNKDLYNGVVQMVEDTRSRYEIEMDNREQENMARQNLKKLFGKPRLSHHDPFGITFCGFASPACCVARDEISAEVTVGSASAASASAWAVPRPRSGARARCGYRWSDHLRARTDPQPGGPP